MLPYKNIIFDWSGVIKDALESQLFVVNKVLAHFNGPQLSKDEFKENWVSPYMVFYHTYLPNLTLEEEQAAYKKYIKEEPLARAYPEMPELVRDLHGAGAVLTVISSDLAETLYPEITRFGLENIFDEVVTDVYDKTDSLRRLIKEHAYNPSETVFIGDTNHEIEIGKDAGIHTIGVTWGQCTPERLAKLTPSHLVTTVAELRSILL